MSIPLRLIIPLILLQLACQSRPKEESRPPAPQTVAPPTPAISQPKTATPPKPIARTQPSVIAEVKPVDIKANWKIVKGKLQGTTTQPKPKQIAKYKNEKTPGSLVILCWDYGEFAIIQAKADGEVGDAEVYVHHATPGVKTLCSEDFKGQKHNLKIREVYFAGVAGDLVVLDGADSSEGYLEFQIFSVASGKELFRGQRHPAEDLSIFQVGKAASIEYFAKMKVDCELTGPDSGDCWKSVLAANKVKQPLKKPECKAVTDSALVTAKARVANIAKPKLNFLSGPVTCAPGP